MFGIAPDQDESSDDFEVFEENWPAVELFLRAQTQWRTSVGGVTGLDYAGVVALTKIYSVDNLPDVFLDLQVMEATAMVILNKEKK